MLKWTVGISVDFVLIVVYPHAKLVSIRQANVILVLSEIRLDAVKMFLLAKSVSIVELLSSIHRHKARAEQNMNISKNISATLCWC